MKLSRRELFLLISVLVIAAGALYYTQFFTPIKEDISTLQDESDELMVQINNLKMQNNRIPALKEDLSTLEQDFEELTTSFLKGWDEPLLLVYLENMIGNTAVKDRTMFYLSDPREYYSSGTIDLELTTDYHSLKDIIVELENAPYYNKIQFIEARRRSSYEDLEVTISAVFYTLDDLDFIQDEYSFMTDRYGKDNIFN
ncbi:MAG TPA: hypothetical protein VFD33_05415 [Bacillota bacterium]|nr:hypothetical protein [Bacillota bacterium]